MITRHELLAAVDTAFEITGLGHAPWPDPHPNRRSPLDAEYSRLTSPGKWRIISARAEAWLVTLADLGLAEVQATTSLEWRRPPLCEMTRIDRVVPRADGALTLVVVHCRFASIDDGGVLLGIGDPVDTLTLLPGCGCDACDDGSQHELDELDTYMLSVVSGEFRQLSEGDRTITVLSDQRGGGSGLPLAFNTAAILADPTGWDEVSGESWLPHRCDERPRRNGRGTRARFVDLPLNAWRSSTAGLRTQPPSRTWR